MISQRLHKYLTSISQRLHNDIASISHRSDITFTTVPHHIHNDITTMSHRYHIDLTPISRRSHIGMFVGIFAHRGFMHRFNICNICLHVASLWLKSESVREWPWPPLNSAGATPKPSPHLHSPLQATCTSSDPKWSTPPWRP